MNYLTTRISLSPIRRGFAPGFVNYKKGCTRLAATSDKVYQLLAHGRWFSPGTLSSSTTKTGRHDIAEILLKVALNTINQCKSIICYFFFITAVKYNEEKEKSKQEAKQKKLQQIEDAKKLEAEKGMIYVYRS